MAVLLLSVDVERDVPPYGRTYHGVEEGLPFILDAMRKHDAEGTFFFTYDVANLYPEAVEQVIDHGYEVGCHGYNHENCRKIKNPDELLKKVTAYLRSFDRVIGYRAPYFKMKKDIYPTLSDLGYVYSSSSRGKGVQRYCNVLEIPVMRSKGFSIGMSRMRILGRRILPKPDSRVMSLYVHPWEFTEVKLPVPKNIFTFRCGRYPRKLLEEVLSSDYEFGMYKTYAERLL